MKINFFVETEKTNQDIINLLNKIQNPNVILKDILLYIMPEIQLHILKQENPDGSKYLPPKVDLTRRALIKTGNYINSFYYRTSNNTIEILSKHNGASTHENALEIKNLFGKGIVYKFPQRSAVWLSKTAIEKIIPNIIRKNLN